MNRLYSLRQTWPLLSRFSCILVSAFLVGIFATAQQSLDSSSLHGTLQNSDGKPVAQATVLLQKKDTAQNYKTQTDAQGGYIFSKLPEGIYVLQATKNSYADVQLPSVLLRPGESKTLDLILGSSHGNSSPNSSPQFFDEPQFTVAGVTDTTNLGGHGSDTVVRTRDSLAKDTVSLPKPYAATPDATREKALREAVDRAPSDFTANYQLGHLLVESNRGVEAIAFLQRAAAENPGNYENAYDLARANLQAGHYTLARDGATKLLAKQDRAEVHHLLGDVEERLGDSLEAVRQYQRAAEMEPSESRLFDWGAELLLHHAPEPAQEVFSRGTRLYPKSARMLLGLGAAHFGRGDYDQAIQQICRASDLNPDDPLPYLFLGKIEQSQVVPSGALVEKLRQFVTLQPQNADANYYYGLGLWKLRNAAHQKGSSTQVETLLKTALQIDPKHGPAALQLGIVHADQGAYTDAIADFRRALDTNPQLEEAHYRLSQVYKQVGEPEKATEELRLYGQLAKETAAQQDRDRHEIKQFVYTLRDQSSPRSQ